MFNFNRWLRCLLLRKREGCLDWDNINDWDLVDDWMGDVTKVFFLVKITERIASFTLVVASLSLLN
jgi:hypothetical protein